MRFLYTTDLHGEETSYRRILDHAKNEEFNLIHLGADLLPKKPGILKTQKEFIKGFLKGWYQEAKEAGITVLASFGNDDLYSRKKYFLEYGTLLDDTPYVQNGWTFKAYSWVPVHPYGLLNGCRYDTDIINFNFIEPFKNKPMDLDQNGNLSPVPNVDDYLRARGSIQKDLKNFTSDDKTIVSIHTPPAGLNLDVCFDGRQVGSWAVREWIETHNVGLVLCGHIHEGPKRSGIWMTETNNEITVIQPGQYGSEVIAVEIDLSNRMFKRIKL